MRPQRPNRPPAPYNQDPAVQQSYPQHPSPYQHQHQPAQQPVQQPVIQPYQQFRPRPSTQQFPSQQTPNHAYPRPAQPPAQYQYQQNAFGQGQMPQQQAPQPKMPNIQQQPVYSASQSAFPAGSQGYPIQQPSISQGYPPQQGPPGPQQQPNFMNDFQNNATAQIGMQLASQSFAQVQDKVNQNVYRYNTDGSVLKFATAAIFLQREQLVCFQEDALDDISV